MCLKVGCCGCKKVGCCLGEERLVVVYVKKGCLLLCEGILFVEYGRSRCKRSGSPPPPPITAELLNRQPTACAESVQKIPESQEGRRQGAWSPRELGGEAPGRGARGGSHRRPDGARPGPDTMRVRAGAGGCAGRGRGGKRVHARPKGRLNRPAQRPLCLGQGWGRQR